MSCDQASTGQTCAPPNISSIDFPRQSRIETSDQVRKSLLKLSELVNPEPDKEGCDNKADRQPWKINGTLPAQDAPAEAVDHRHHRVERIKQSPLLRNDA